MGFVTDKQTLDDLQILGRYQVNSIFNLFNHTVTKDASRLLERMFKAPFSNIEQINTRTAHFQLFQRLNIALPFTSKEFEIISNYLRNAETNNRVKAAFNTTKYWFLNKIANDKNYIVLYDGLKKNN